ncbi:hypothetical protein NDI52_32080, partial [Leptolyngbya sp. PL-A3]|uniref:hypothetical protein n=1 Tax=Leptolyngbya sp. PL-A3 TaxID=2933911 RepID=UPI003299D670
MISKGAIALLRLIKHWNPPLLWVTFLMQVFHSSLQQAFSDEANELLVLGNSLVLNLESFPEL